MVVNTLDDQLGVSMHCLVLQLCIMLHADSASYVVHLGLLWCSCTGSVSMHTILGALVVQVAVTSDSALYGIQHGLHR